MILSDFSVTDVVDRNLLTSLVDGVVARPRADRIVDLAPFTGDPLAEIPVSTPDDVTAAFAAARDGQRGWADRPLHERARVLLRLHDLVLDRRSEIADVMQAEAGKARRDALEEIMDVALAARYAARRGPALLRDRRRLGAVPGLTHAVEVRRPKGVVGIISPWNYPLTLAISDALPAFMAGNAVVHKPDSQTMLTALLARSIALEAGLPETLWQIVCGDGPTIGKAVIAEADYVSFTGSTATGRLVGAQTGERLIGASLELGGKNPMLVLDDADVPRSAAGAVQASYTNCGQLCLSTERIYVADAVYGEFLDRFVAAVDSLTLGAAFDYSCEVGSLLSQEQADKVAAHVDDAIAKGARVMTGGKARPDLGPWFFEPTVLTGVRPGMLAADEETFGPVVSVYRVASDDEAVASANGTPYGLNASVWTRNHRRGIAVAKRLQYGVVSINDGYQAAWASHDLPSGGVKASGMGRRHGAEGILRYTEPQAIAVQRFTAFTPPIGTPWDQFERALVSSARLMRRLRRP